MAKAIFAAGCFWGVEQVFRGTPGVMETAVGYIGGSSKNPTYEQVCTGKTGHAEAVEVIYELEKVGFEDLLDVFWKCHDPTQINRQGPDIGTQYRSAIFYLDDEQKNTAETSKNLLQSKIRPKAQIATLIEPAGTFYMAEEYHQQYFEKRGRYPFLSSP